MKKSILLIALLGTLASPAMATYFTAEYIGAGSASSSLPNAKTGGPGPSLAPGLYVQVITGQIHVSNGGGTQNFSTGQFGFLPTITTPPSVLPSNPGLSFAPPPSFSNTSTSNSNSTTGGTQARDNAVNCEVR